MKKLTLILSLIVIASPSWAQETLHLSQIIEKVENYNPDLKLKQREKDVAKFEKRAALGQALPQLSAKVSHMQNFNVPKFEIPGQGTFQMQGDYSMEYGATINQALYTFGAVKAALTAAERGFEMVDIDIEATKNDVTYQAKVAYFQVLFAKQNVEINQRLLNNAQANLSILRQNFSGGRPPQGDLLRLQADVENKKPQLENAKAELKAAKIALNILMGDDPHKDYNIVGELRESFPVLSPGVLQNDLEKEAPVLKVLEKNAEFQDSLADIQRSATLPKLGLFYSFNRLDQSYTERFSKDQTLTTSTLGVSLNWNIWDGGISHANYQKAKVNASKSLLDLQKAKDSLNRQVLASLEQFNNYKKNVSYLRKAVVLARESFRLSQSRFRSGRTSITELNDTQSLLLQSELQQSANLFQMNMTYSLIESLIGKDLK